MEKCTMCGNELSDEDDFRLNYRFGYFNPNGRDGDMMSVKLCSCCTEKMASYFEEKCVINPIRQGEYI